MELMDFKTDRYMEMNFTIKASAVPIYINHATMNNRIKLDSGMNYFRYRRLEEYKTVTIASLKSRTLGDISIERG